MSYIKKLQNKPENTRKQILVGSLVACMSIVVFIWVYSFSNNLSDQSASNTETNQEGLKPFQLFANSISSTYKNISASVGNISSSNKPDTTPAPKQIDLIPVDPITHQPTN